MKLLEVLSAPYWMALYRMERATRDEDMALIARLKRDLAGSRAENKRLRVKLLDTVVLLKEAVRKEIP